MNRSESKTEGKKVTLEMSLPMHVFYERAVFVSIANPDCLQMIDVSLLFKPYYLFEYKIDFERIDRTGGIHKFENEGNHVVDAQNGKIISSTPMPDSKIYFPKLFSQAERLNLQNLEIASDLEENYIVRDLGTIKPEYKYDVEIENPKYRVNIKPAKVPERAARHMVIEELIDENTKEVSYEVKTQKERKTKKKYDG